MSRYFISDCNDDLQEESSTVASNKGSEKRKSCGPREWVVFWHYTKGSKLNKTFVLLLLHGRIAVICFWYCNALGLI
jgi:hypothetical protein